MSDTTPDQTGAPEGTPSGTGAAGIRPSTKRRPATRAAKAEPAGIRLSETDAHGVRPSEADVVEERPLEADAQGTPLSETASETAAPSILTTPETMPAESTLARATPRPRIRWGAIVWGLIVCGIAAATLQVTRTEEGREGYALWLTRLTPGGIWLIVVLLAGGILFLLGLLAVIRRAQRAR